MRVKEMKRRLDEYHNQQAEKIRPNYWKESTYYIPGFPIRSKEEFVGGYHDAQLHDFSGLGPKNYSPSDERIMEKLCDELIDNPFIDASEIEVEVKDSVVELSGFVLDKWMKYDVEELAERIAGVKNVISNLETVKRGKIKSANREHPYYSGEGKVS